MGRVTDAAHWRIEQTDAHALAIALASDALCREPASLRIGHLCPRCGSGEHGRPLLVDAQGPVAESWISISRSGGWSAAIASTCGPVGIDIEDAHASVPADVVTHPEERWSPGDLVRVWASKEAVVKALGTGLATDSRSIFVSPGLDAAVVAGVAFALTPLAAPNGLVAVACLREQVTSRD